MTENQDDLWSFIEALPTLSEEEKEREALKKNPALYDEVGAPEKRKMNLFDVIAAIDMKRIGYYDEMTPEVQTEFEKSTFPLMTWLSSVENPREAARSLICTNMILNQNFRIYKNHPGLFFKLAAAFGPGKTQKHKWVARAKRDSLNKVEKFLLQWYPNVNDLELETIMKDMTRDSMVEFAKTTGANDKTIKELTKEWNEKYGK